MRQLETNVTFFEQIFDHQPESAVWVQPIWQEEPMSDKTQIIDFQFKYCNPASKRTSKQETLLDKYILADKLPDPGACQLIFEQCLAVYRSGEPIEYSYFSTTLDKFLTLHRVKVLDGVLTTVRNRTIEHAIQIEKERQARLLESLVEKSPFGISLYESIRDQSGQIADFKLRMCNQKSAEITALSLEELQTKTVKELIQQRGGAGYFEICKKVVETGKSHYTEYYSATLDKWIGFSIVKFDDGYLLNYIDITQTKRFELEAKANAHELNAIFNGSLSGVYTAKALRNDQGMVNDLVFLRANDSFYRAFSATPEKIIGKTLSLISGTDDQTAFIQFVQKVLESGEAAVHVLEYKNPTRWYEFSIVKLDGDTVAVTINDITTQKHNIVAIERQKNLLDNIMRQSPNGLSVTKAIRDREGEMIDARTVLLNDACEKLNGVPNDVLLAHTMGELSPELLVSPVFTAAKALKTGDSFRTEYYLPLTKRWLELAIAKMDEDHFINVFTDITAIKEVHQELEKTIADLKRSNAHLEDFAHAASHDMKEPLRKIRTFIDRLKHNVGSRLEETESHLFDRIDTAAERMQLLVDDLLEFSHVSQSGQQMELVDLNEKVQKVLADLELPIEEKSAKITLHPLPCVNGNRRQLQQLFQNLVSNALKYSKPNTPPKISISSQLLKGEEISYNLPVEQKGGSFHLIEVADNGIGFGQEYAEQIFGMFQRLHGKAEYAGTGVGLSIARKVVENHNGYIWAESKLGEGATFKVLLPAE